MNQSETVTLFNDMCALAPGTLVDPRIVWHEPDAQSVGATFTNAGNTISAVLYFDPSGALVDFISDDRLQTRDGKTYECMQWSTPVRDWHELDGRRVPVGAEAIWRSQDSEFTYAHFEIVEVEYNVRGEGSPRTGA